ncbi:MAG: SLATT domain-containing protein [Planctomycetales bacterium]|nr:SLATT domain-containing protein [Planctomycetales bacterium]
MSTNGSEAEGILRRLFEWLFSLSDSVALPTDQKDVLLRQIHLTSKCRYNASIRLKRLGRGTFLTTTILSLGLILMPMLQLARLRTAYPDPVVSSLQIFLAVAVLVYSIISATATYDTRARVLNDCADRIKHLGGELRTALQTGAPDLNEYAARYNGITRDSEMHSRSDYALAMLQARSQYNITGLKRLWLRVVVLVSESFPYIPSIGLLTIETILVTDMLGITSMWTPFMNALNEA